MSEIPLDSSMADHADITRTQGPSISARELIGPYRVLEQLGEGGMGEVWLAEQTKPVRRQVALKIIKAGMDTAQVVARFEAERQALALMDHPAIARVFDAGVTPQGRPYFAMEYVRGESLTTYCDRQRLTIRERLDLFLHLCEGVHHAHQKGIIHRDLKPSNILVTLRDDHPVPKIIDFGISKAMSQPLTEHTLYTSLTGFVGTAEYMSPEQAEMGGADVDTRTDVYALGIVLYELLTGVLPFDRRLFRDKALDEVRRIIREVVPPKSSTRIQQLGQASLEVATNRRTEPSRLVSVLRGDLDWITMKAVEKDRGRRYGSASDFAADIRRHIAHDPVLAGPPSSIYRARKFVRRHRFGVGAIAVVLVLLLSFATALTIQNQRITRERDRTNQEAEMSKQVSNFLVGLFKVSDPSEARGNTLTAREILDKGASTIEQTLAAQPKTQARLEATIGTVYTNLGLYGAAEPLLRRALAAALKESGENGAETLATTSALADVYWYQGRYSEAETLYTDLVQRRRRLFGERDPETLKVNFDLASLYMVQGRLQEAEELNRGILGIQREVLGDQHPDTLASLNNLAVVLQRQHRYAEALPVNVQLLEIRKRILGRNHPDTLRSLHNLAVNYSQLGRLQDADELFVLAINGRRQVLGDAHPATVLSRSRLAANYKKNGVMPTPNISCSLLRNPSN